MNRIFKVIKNKRHIISSKVVSENASSNVRSSDKRSSINDDQRSGIIDSFNDLVKRSLPVLLIPLLALQYGYADIIADPSAPLNQQPTILNTASGATQVNIQTPTAAGISVNQYTEFNTGANGTILNNSRTNTNTVTAGWVQANPWLYGGTAKAIVNQVNSSNPSNLTGNIEIAGSKADFIIANPSGISIDGATIINAGGTTLTTGTPLLNNGNLDGFNVNNGTVSIQGAGLNALGSDYTNILAHAAVVNAGIWAQNLKIVTGTNTVLADGTNIAADTPTAPAPLFAVDSSALGGMYANSITLIGTENGVGVNNAGVISAGNVSIDENGILTNSGIMASENKTSIRSQGIVNSGTVSSNGNIDITLDNNLENSGTINSSLELITRSSGIANLSNGFINAARLDLEADILSNSGRVNQSGLSELDILSQNITNINGALMGVNETDPSGSGSQGDLSTPSSSSDSSSVTTQQADQTQPLGSGTINVSNIINDSGSITSNIQTNVSLNGALVNSAAMNLGTLDIAGGTIDNSGGKITANYASIDNDSFINTNGSFEANSQAVITSGLINNDGGTISSSQYLDITTASLVNNGTISSMDYLELTLEGPFTNNSWLTAGGTLILNSGVIQNYGGIAGLGALEINADTLDNYNTVFSGGDALLFITGLLRNNTDSNIFAAGSLAIGANANGDKTANLENFSGYIGSGGDMAIRASNILNQGEVSLNYAVYFENLLNGQILTEQEFQDYMDANTGKLHWDKWKGYSDGLEGTMNWIVDNNYYDYLTLNYHDEMYDLTINHGQNHYITFPEWRSNIEDTSTVKPATITSGGSLLIDSDNLTNKDGTISSVGDMQIYASTLNNIATQVSVDTELVDRTIHWWTKHHTMSDNDIYLQYGFVENYGGTSLIGGRSLIVAGGTLSGSFGALQNGMADGQNVLVPLFNSSQNALSVNPISAASTNPYSLFITSSDPLAPMFQTNPAYTDYKNFISSDYMIQSLGIDTTVVLKRLGDGYYEQRLVAEQIASLTGKKFLGDYISNEEQYIALMTAGITYAKEFNLTPGVALSALQMAQLTTNMVWLVEQEVNGAKVLVPTVYLSQNSQRQGGAYSSTISANNGMNLRATGLISNSGTISSGGSLAINAGLITNNQGAIQAQNSLSMTATNDMTNISGTITGGSVSIKSTEGNIVNQTLTQGVDATRNEGDQHYTLVGRQATISSTSGNVVLDAANDIQNSGANISSAGSIWLKAGRDIVVDTVTDETSHDYKLTTGYTKGEGTTNIASNISANESIATNSGGDTKIIGANVKAGENIILKAGSSLDILAAVDSDYETSKFVDKGSWGKKMTTNNVTLEQDVVSTNIDGKNVIVDANDDITFQGSNIHATDNIIATTKEGDINVLAASYEESELHQITKKGTLWLSKSMNLKSTDSQNYMKLC